MSQHVATKRLTAPDILARKGGEPIVSLTAYHAHTAAIADKYVDFLLVGDSLGMVMHGFESTLPVPLDLISRIVKFRVNENLSMQGKTRKS